jgi:ubiquinol-cytochrome c reductase iron-sulfur subunit
MDITDLPPGEVMQIGWNGMNWFYKGIPVFVRRLTAEEVKNENEAS